MKSLHIIDEKNSGNLYSFYREIGFKSGFQQGEHSSARYIMDNAKSWPSYILGGGKMVRSSLLEIFELMKAGKLPHLWIRPVNDDPDFEEFAGEHGIRKINFWRGMNLERDKAFNLLAPVDNIVFEEVKTPEDLKDWLKVVNAEIMTHRELGINTFMNILHDPAFRFFRISNGKKTLSTLLAHQRKTETGIYMVSTQLNERGKGLGRWITTSAIDYFIARNCRNFVLHATPLGYPVYLKLGFVECCEYGIFWLLGKK
ncbi:MAG: hypothetical protein H6540_02665 [Bacteroidales bacterium]|nr:hypothetical protein [Bacteroidales bacterium]